MYSKLTIIGRLGADPEMRYTASGKAVTNLRVAVDQGYGDSKTTLWVSVTCWGGKDGKEGMAEAAAKYVHKGSKVFVEGEPAVRAYVAGDGAARASLGLNARELRFLDDRPKQNGNDVDPDEATPS